MHLHAYKATYLYQHNYASCGWCVCGGWGGEGDGGAGGGIGLLIKVTTFEAHGDLLANSDYFAINEYNYE